LRASHPTLVAASRAINGQRDVMVARWSAWLRDRLTVAHGIDPALVERQLVLILDVLAAMVGPLRRETKPIWARVTEHYGQMAAARGLAAGEVVEEMQYLRELLIRYLAPSIAALRPRQGMALLLRLNRVVDQGVAIAVAGYTDAIVRTLLPGHGGELTPDTESFDGDAAERELTDLARSLSAITSRIPG
jgi:hypothetical protein